MFNKLLSVLGFKKTETTQEPVAPYKVEAPAAVEIMPEAIEFEQPPAVITASNKTADKKVTTVKEVTVKTSAKPKKEPAKYNRAALEEMTKAQLEEIGSGEFGLSINRKQRKPEIVELILKEQRNAGKR